MSRRSWSDSQYRAARRHDDRLSYRLLGIVYRDIQESVASIVPYGVPMNDPRFIRNLVLASGQYASR